MAATSFDYASERKGAARRAALSARARRRLFYIARNRIGAWARADLADRAPWAPAAVGLGAGVYFALKAEPAAIFAPAIFAAFTSAGFLWPRLRPFMIPAALIALGFLAADWRTARVAAPILDRDLGIVDVAGTIVEAESGADRQRFIIALNEVARLEAGETPARARITWRGAPSSVRAGDRVTLRAGLGPPPPPVLPGGFDFARQLYFQRIGAVGFAVSSPAILERAADEPPTMSVRIERLRDRLSQRIRAAAPGRAGGVVAAIVTGKRDAVLPEAEHALRDAGLAHLLAISGLHMGLATGLVFAFARLAAAAAGPMALRIDGKKWAAVAALAAGAFYLAISGAGWSPRRAFIMTACILAAILVDRRALSLRNVAIAGGVILLTTPEALFHPGFQMSFAAVTALIAGFEYLRARAPKEPDFSVGARARRYLFALAATDVIAALATAPFALYHFNRAALYSLPANMLAMPIMGLWIMPAAAAGVLLSPFGLDGWCWRIAAAGVEAILRISETVAGWPGAVALTAQWPLPALLVLVGGGLILCLLRSPFRLAGLAAAPVAAGLVAGAPRPQILVAPSGENAAVLIESPEGRDGFAAYSARRDRFALNVWSEAAGFAYWRRMLLAEAGSCDRAGCVVAVDGARVAISAEAAGLAEDCARSDLVVALYSAPRDRERDCGARLIDRRAARAAGAHAIYIEPSGAAEKPVFIIIAVAETRGERPWSKAQ